MELKFNSKSKYFSTSPFQEIQCSCQARDELRNISRRKEIWKNKPNGIFSVSKISSFLFMIFFCMIIGSVSSQDWDGIIVTEADYQALQAFKHELTDPNGVLKSWNDSGYGACSGSWVGIKCAKGQVIVIQLPWRGLSGRITEKIGQFQALRKLSLHDNSITGQIPTSLGFLPNLRGVQLYNNRISGSIPASLGLCPVLQTLDFSNNSLSGPIPFSVVNSTKLFMVNFSYNQLSGEIPVSITHSPSLVFIALEYNNLSGVIPDSFAGLSLIQDINLSHNQLSGVLPSGIGNLSALRNFDVSENFIDGSLPTGLFNLKNISVLDLSHNNLSGEIPASLGELPNLDSFSVSYNNLSGSVPANLMQKFNSSAFTGNLLLCGYSASTPCTISPPPSPPHERRKRKLSIKDIILILFGVLLVILLVTCCILVCCLIRRRKSEKEPKEKKGGVAGGEKRIPPTAGEVEASGENGGRLVHFDGALVFSADDLLCATAEIMGKSTYGTVYRATMEDGIQVAVKRLREKVTKGQREFETEVNLIGKIRHPNLLALRGYYLGPKGEKLLVFDYMPKGSLANFLHARAPDTPIDWATRMKIAKGMTRGLLHLHNNANIIHGNLTSSNVLLDDHTNAKIADYGLWRLMTDAANANVITTSGALGYRAPELSKLKKASTKTDVYSLGVIFLELLTGKSPGEVMNGVDLPRWVASIVKEEWTSEVFDLELMRDVSGIGDELINTLKLALHCVDPSPSARPEAHQILQQLEDIRMETAVSSAVLSPSD